MRVGKIKSQLRISAAALGKWTSETAQRVCVNFSFLHVRPSRSSTPIGGGRGGGRRRARRPVTSLLTAGLCEATRPWIRARMPARREEKKKKKKSSMRSFPAIVLQPGAQISLVQVEPFPLSPSLSLSALHLIPFFFFFAWIQSFSLFIFPSSLFIFSLPPSHVACCRLVCFGRPSQPDAISSFLPSR